MASVANDEANVVLLGKVDGSNHIVGRRDIDRVVNIVAQKTRAGLEREGVTAVVGKVGLHDGRRRCDAVTVSIRFSLSLLESVVSLLGLGKVPSILQSSTSSSIISRIMAGRSNGNGGNQPTTDCRVESSPGGSRGPAAVSGHATALARGARIVARSGEDGQRGQHPRILHGVARERRGGVRTER